MKRELTFRAWCEINEKWIYFTIGQQWSEVMRTVYFRIVLSGSKFYQFTGFKDKNGVEIYEGDILEFTDKWEWYRGVWFSKLHFADGKEKEDLKKQYDLLPTHKLEVEICFKEGVSFSVYDLEQSRYQVIGNIHENPNLLK